MTKTIWVIRTIFWLNPTQFRDKTQDYFIPFGANDFFLLQKLFIFFDWTCRRRGVDVVDKTNDKSDERLSDFEPEIARDAGME